ncbi:hypothetical protein KM043_007858 [Ampulex compressa]|nr:hypothetical protein KM043_007858 [Ampulex compressa]
MSNGLRPLDHPSFTWQVDVSENLMKGAEGDGAAVRVRENYQVDKGEKGRRRRERNRQGHKRQSSVSIFVQQLTKSAPVSGFYNWPEVVQLRKRDGGGGPPLTRGSSFTRL